MSKEPWLERAELPDVLALLKDIDATLKAIAVKEGLTAPSPGAAAAPQPVPVIPLPISPAILQQMLIMAKIRGVLDVAVVSPEVLALAGQTTTVTYNVAAGTVGSQVSPEVHHMTYQDGDIAVYVYVDDELVTPMGISGANDFDVTVTPYYFLERKVIVEVVNNSPFDTSLTAYLQLIIYQDATFFANFTKVLMDAYGYGLLAKVAQSLNGGKELPKP